MRERPPDPDLEPATRERLESFSLDPSDTNAFRRLEEDLFLSGSFSKLAGMYDCRLSVLSQELDEWRNLTLRLAELYEERLGDPARARAHYERLLQARPQDSEALACLRRLHVRAGSLTQALQISEIEERLPLDPARRAALLAETGSLWIDVGEVSEAEERLRTALSLDAGCEPALAGLAALAQARGELDQAVELHELRLARLAGAARAAALEQLVDLLPASASDRARLYLRDAVRADPRRRGALERLILLERDSGDSQRLDALRSSLWKLARDGPDRLRIAREGAREQLEMDSIEQAARWLEEASPYGQEDPQLAELRVAIYRRAGDTQLLLDALESQSQGGTPADPTRLLELAVLEERQNRPERALRWAQQALTREPDDPEILAVASRLLGRLGRHTERAQVLEHRIRIEPEAESRQGLLVELGDLHAGELGDPDRAASDYRRAIHENPGVERAFERLADLLQKCERHEALDRLLSERAEASVERERAAELWCRVGELRLNAPRHAAPRLHEGGTSDPGAHEPARAAFQRALEIDSASRRALTGLHAAAEAISDPQARLEACELELAMDLTPGRRRELLRLRAKLAEQQGDSPTALRAAEDWLELEPVPEAFEAVARSARKLGDASRERRALEALLEEEAAGPERRGDALRRLGDLALASPSAGSLEEAARYYRAAFETRADPELRGRLIDLYRQLGRLPLLIEALRSALQSGPETESRRLRLELAEVQLEASDPPGAAQTLWEEVRRDPLWGTGARRLEQLLDDQGLSSDRAELLSLQLEREQRPEERRALLTRLGALLLDERGCPDEAAERTRELAAADRFDALEEVYERALEASGRESELLRWLSEREPRVGPGESHPLRLRLARLQARQDRRREALDTLRRAAPGASESEREEIRLRRLAIVEGAVEPRERDALLGRLLEQVTEDVERSQLHVQRGRLRACTLGDPRGALAELDRAAALAPLDPGALRLLAQVAGESGRDLRRAAALEGLAEVTRDLTERVAIRLEIAGLYGGSTGSPDLSRAEAQLRRALCEVPGDRRVRGALAHLLEERGDRRGLASLLRDGLEDPDLDPGERTDLALRLASIAREPAERASARVALEAAISAEPDLPGPADALQGLLAIDDPRACEALCFEELRGNRAPESGVWARRWLAALARLELDPLDELRRIEAVTGPARELPALIERRIRLYAEAPASGDRDRAHAAALEERLHLGPAGPDARRRAWVRDLAALLAGPLHEPRRALDWLESESRGDPPWTKERALLALELTQQLGDSAREQHFLRVLADLQAASPDHERRRGLLASRSGDASEAAPLLEQALARNPADLEALGALETLARRHSDEGTLARVLELRFPICGESEREQRVVEGAELAERRGDRAGLLRWLRRASQLESPPEKLLRARAELELSVGDSGMALRALESLAATNLAPTERGDTLVKAAQIHERRGELTRARGLYAEALGLLDLAGECAPLPWIEAQLQVLGRLGLDSESLDLLKQIERHPAVSPNRSTEARRERLALLCRTPELADRAAREVSSALSETRPGRLQVELFEQLLEVHEARDSVLEWCDTAERLLSLEAAELEPPRADALERRLASRLELELGNLPRARAVWERVDARAPDDREALAALERLNRDPSRSAVRAQILERIAAHGDPAAAQTWIRAARLRAERLGDLGKALEDVEAALALDPENPDAHQLRAQICAQSGLADAERESLLKLEQRRSSRAFGPQQALRLAELLASDESFRDKAMRCAGEALSRARAQSEEPEFRTSLASVLERLGSFSLAIELQRESLAALEAESCAAPLREIARLAWEGRGDSTLTRDALEALSEIEPLRGSDLRRFAAALEAAGEHQGALTLRRAQLEAEGDAAPTAAWRSLASDARALGDLRLAREACVELLRRVPDDRDALTLRAWAHREAGDARAELEDRMSLGARVLDGPEAARELVQAARIARDVLGESARASQLFIEALARDEKSLPALLGAGELALEHSRWPDAERWLCRACEQVDATPQGADERDPRWRADLAKLASQAARAAHELDHAELELRHLELALDAGAAAPETLEAAARVALRLGALALARRAIEARLSQSDLGEELRADWLRRLAHARSGSGDPAGALSALEDAARRVPGDEVTLAGLVELCESLGDRERALRHLDAWCRSAPEDCRPELTLRAARLELAIERPDRARERLEALLEGSSRNPEARALLAELELEALGPAAALARIEGTRDESSSRALRATCSWIEARAREALGESGNAARLAFETLELDPAHVAAARMLAHELGHAPDFAAAVRLLEDHLDAAHAPPHVEAELAEAIGRSYAGPLEDLGRAQSAFRRALECNPARTRVREALADVSSFDPDSHLESVRLHRELLEADCTRVASWEALLRIALQWRRTAVESCCRAVLSVLTRQPEVPPGEAPRVARTDCVGGVEIESANRLLKEIQGPQGLPELSSDPGIDALPEVLREGLIELAGPLGVAGDRDLSRLFRNAARDSASSASSASLPRRMRRIRRRLQRIGGPSAERALEQLDPEVWRSHALAQAASRVFVKGKLSLGDAIEALVRREQHQGTGDSAWETGDPVALIPESRSARALLLRVADGCVDALGA